MSVSQNNTPKISDKSIRRLTTGDAAWLSALHATGFDEIQRWTVDLFRSMLAQPTTRGYVFIVGYDPVGFLIGRRVVDEGEILTLCIDPAHRRKGYGEMLIEHFAQDQKREGISKIFLEVNVGNRGAIALYEKMAFKNIATRPNYYQMPEGSEKAFMDGYVMTKLYH